ncbi:MAG: hypothetical protein IH993_01730 [Proteobacteria bacterium]|nr:hypothetical protein [Pseudomonadota bacterium]
MTVVASISRSFGGLLLGDGAGHGAPCGQGLLLGYAAVSEPKIEKCIETLARALEDAAL